MKIMKYFAGLLALSLLCTGCSSETSQETPPPETTVSTQPKKSTTEPIQETTEPEIPTYSVEPLDYEPVENESFEYRAEAEESEYSGTLLDENILYGYSGEGYLSGFSNHEGDNVKARIAIPTSQHYDITVCVCADAPVKNALTVNGKVIGEFSITEPNQFTRITFSSVYLSEGEAVLSVKELDGYFLLDYFEITNSNRTQQLSYHADYPLSDAEATTSTQNLMHWLSLNYGAKMVSGQYVSDSSNTEMEVIHRLTGKYPAIRFADIGCYTANSSADAVNVIADSLQWAENGGIIGLMWYWDAPEGISSVYAEETDFHLSDAIPELVEVPPAPAEPPEDEEENDEDSEEEEELTAPDIMAINAVDVALLKPTEIDELVAQKKISHQCASLIKDIDSVSDALKAFAKEDVPILWRPLHEAGGGWYWWGADGAEAYQWLWNLMYKRMTEYHQLHNLIWIWNGQDSNYLVNQYDIASLDIYLDPAEDFSSRHEQFIRLYEMTGGEKLLAISECSSIPDVNHCFRDHTVWSFCGLWYDEYLMTNSGMYNGNYTPAKKMISFYNSEAVLTLDDTQKGFEVELPVPDIEEDEEDNVEEEED